MALGVGRRTVKPEHVQSWQDYLATVEVRGPIPIAFEIVQDTFGIWILRSTMLVPDRADATGHIPIIFQQALPAPDDPTPRELVIRQRVLGCFQHEALESVFIDGQRCFDPHEAHWYSNLVADWRFNR